jgi:hypothetical protein
LLWPRSGRARRRTASYLKLIAEKAEAEEARASFDAVADARFASIISSGETIPWSEMRQYLSDRIAGKNVPRPVAMLMREKRVLEDELAGLTDEKLGMIRAFAKG